MARSGLSDSQLYAMSLPSAESRMDFHVSMSHEVTYYPTSINLHVLRKLDNKPRALAKGFEYVHSQLSIGENINTALFTSHLVDNVAEANSTSLFQLSLNGKSLLHSLEKGYLWSSKIGRMTHETNRFYQEIVDRKFDECTFKHSYSVPHRYGTNYSTTYLDMEFFHFEFFATMEWMDTHKLGTEFKRAVMLMKLMRAE